MTFANLRISLKLGGAFALLLAVFAFTGATLLSTQASVSKAHKASSHSERVALDLAELKFSLTRQENSLRGFLLSGDDYYLNRLAQTHKPSFERHMASLRDLLADDAAAQQQLDALQAAFDTWHKDAIATAVALGRDPATRAQAAAMVGQGGVVDKMLGPAEEVMDSLGKAETVKHDIAEARQVAAASTAGSALLIGFGFITVLALALAVLLTRSIAAPVKAMTLTMSRLARGDNTVTIPAVGRRDEIGQMAEAVQAFKDAALEKLRVEALAERQAQAGDAERRANEAERARAAAAQALVVDQVASGLAHLAKGDLTCRLTKPFAAEYEDLRRDFNAAMAQLEDTVRTIAGATQGIDAGTSEISGAADNLSRRTEQQAASLEETAAALDQITATVRKSSEGAQAANGAIRRAGEDTSHGRVVVRDAVAAMAQIEQSAQQISQIIGVIDEIAFQTNLLALNAGVEAARAGDAGKGFAVVASEVRALAQRSADAAKQIKTLISTSSDQVARGVALVGQTDEALERIVGQVTEIGQRMAEIALSAQEQSTGLHQVNIAVNQMDQVTQQNAAMVEESTAASHALAQESSELARLIGQFRLSNEGRSVHRAA